MVDAIQSIIGNLQIDDKQAEEFQAQKKQAEFKAWQATNGISKKYIDACIGGLMSQDTIKALDKFKACYLNGQAPILLVMGQVGTGKTYALASLLNALATGYFIDMTELKLKVTSSERFGAESYETLMHRLASYKLLALDEVGRFRSQQEQEILFYLINSRYSNDLPLIISSNLDGVELAKYLGTALYDRISCKLIKLVLNGDSLRQNDLI